MDRNNLTRYNSLAMLENQLSKSQTLKEKKKHVHKPVHLTHQNARTEIYRKRINQIEIEVH